MRTLTAWLLVNNQREFQELPSICISAVGTCIAKLKPLVENMKNEKHGCSDRNAASWQARFLLCLQFSLKINLNTLGEARNILVENKTIETKEGKLPKEFGPAYLTNLFVDQFVTWNEVLRIVIPGSDDGYVHTPNKDHTMKLPRDDNGKLDISKGTYSIEKEKLTKCKYTDKFRLCLIVCVVTPVIDGVKQPQ